MKARDYPDHPFYNRMWLTKNSRYEGARRLRRRGLLSLWTISALSVYAILLALAQIAQLVSGPLLAWVPFVALALSIVVLVVSVLETGANYAIRAESLHRSGNEIDRLVDDFESKHRAGRINGDYEQEMIENYHAVIARYADNHEKIDYEIVVARSVVRESKDIAARLRLWKRQAEHWFRVEFLYWTVIVLPFAMGIYLVLGGRG